MSYNQTIKKLFNRFRNHWFLEETLCISSLIWPNLVANSCSYLVLNFAPIIFAGQILKSTTMLAGVTLCVTIFTLFAFLPMYGIVSAFDTLATQAFGSRDYKMLGVYLQRGFLVLFTLSLPIAALLLQIDQFLLLLGEDPEIVQVCRNMLQYCVFILPFLTVLAFWKIAEAQGILIPNAILLFIATLVDISVTLLILYLISSSVFGLVAGIVICHLALWILYVIYLYVSGMLKRIWGGFTWRVFSRWGEIFLLGVPISAGLMADGLLAQLGTFVVGLGKPDPAVEISIYSAIIGFSDLVELSSYAVLTGVSIRVGNLVGEGNVSRSRLVAIPGVILALTIASILLLVICIPKNVIGHLFISNMEVVDGISNTILYLIPSSLLMAFVYTLSGVLSGYGKQWVILVQIVVALIVGLPISLVLTRNGWGVKGYWIGVIAGKMGKALVTLLAILYYILCAKIMKTSQERIDDVQNSDELVSLISQSPRESREGTINREMSEVKRYSLSGRSIQLYLKKMYSWMFSFLFIFISVCFFLLVVICKYSGMEHVFYPNKTLNSSVKICCMRFVFNSPRTTNSTIW